MGSGAGVDEDEEPNLEHFVQLAIIPSGWPVYCTSDLNCKEVKCFLLLQYLQPEKTEDE